MICFNGEAKWRQYFHLDEQFLHQLTKCSLENFNNISIRYWQHHLSNPDCQHWIRPRKNPHIKLYWWRKLINYICKIIKFHRFHVISIIMKHLTLIIVWLNCAGEFCSSGPRPAPTLVLVDCVSWSPTWIIYREIKLWQLILFWRKIPKCHNFRVGSWDSLESSCVSVLCPVQCVPSVEGITG